MIEVTVFKMNEIIDSIIIDESLESYDVFLENEWAEQVTKVSRHASKLEKFMLNLILDWRGISYTASLPSQIPKSLKNFHDSFVKLGKPNMELIEITETYSKRLTNEVEEIRSWPELRTKVQETLVRIGDDVLKGFQIAPIELNLEKIWKEYREINYIKFSIWSSQRICYKAFYDAYETFVLQCMRVVVRQPTYKIRKNKIENDFIVHFGKPLYDQCWGDTKIKISRLTRHALSHTRGQITAELKKHDHGFELVNDVVQIKPKDLNDLYNVLKNSVLDLATKASSISQFS